MLHLFYLPYIIQFLTKPNISQKGADAEQDICQYSYL